ncbi:MAG TPA: hypothetical protein VGF24_12180 [Vicinamibacterales bacterium]|jgi:hypothetical protein
MAFLAGWAEGQTPTTGAITFLRVEAKQVSPPEGPGLHWVVGLGGASVRVDDAELQRSIESWVSDPARKRHPWILDRRTSWGVLEELFASLRDYRFERQDPFRIAPSREETRQNALVQFGYERLPLPSSVSDITIEICTEQATQICIDRVRQGAAIAALDAQVTQLDLGRSADKVTARAVVLNTELEPPVDRVRMTMAFTAVADEVLRLAESEGVRVGARPVDANLFAVQNRIAQVFQPTLSGVSGDRPSPLGTLDWLAPRGEGHLRIFVRNARLLKEVRLEVPLIRVDTAHGSASMIAERQQRALKVKADTEQQAVRRLDAAFEVLRQTVPTNTSLEQVLDAVQRDEKLRPPIDMVFKGPTLEIIARDGQARFGFETTLEGGWSAEDRLFGKGTFNGDNLLRLERPQRVENESVSFSGLNETQRLTASFQLETRSGRPRGGSLVRGLYVNALLAHDRDQLFGNASPSRLSLASGHVSPSYEIVLTAPTRDQMDMLKSTLVALRASVGMSIASGHVRTEEGAFVSPAPEQGSYIGVTATQTLQITQTIRPPTSGGLGEVRLLLEAKALYAPAGLDSNFGRAESLIDISALLGLAQSRDYIVRYRTRVAGASPGTPLFELPRLGGEWHRGIEDGEFVGYRVGSAQLSAGPSLEHLVTWFGKPRPTGVRLGPFPLADVYVTGFLDRGAAFARAPLGTLLWPTATTGYGFAVELQNLPVSGRRARLTIGYGRSPDSTRHRHGTVATTLSLDFN